MGTIDDPRDVGLILRIRNGDSEALNALLRAYWVRLHRYARSIVGSLDAADDVVQEVFVRVWRHRATLSIPSGVASYLYRMTRNQALTWLESDRTRHAREAQWSAALSNEKRVPHNEGELTAEHSDVYALLMDALSALPPRCREIFLLHWEHNLSYAQIAALLNISVPTIRNQMSRAVTHLATILEQPGSDLERYTRP
jgi:RNA polymerase sigma-70 factor (ECF subfamily)